MKKITLLFLLVASFYSTKAVSQCTSFTGGGPWTDFNGTFGGAPCDPGTGCPFNEITGFQVWADESYLMNNVVAGSTYTFSTCGGVGGTAWDISFTVIAPSGAIDAFGLDAGSICAITWTASESGVYQIGISEAGACDTSTNRNVDNGFPAITCTSGNAPCPIAPDAVTLTSPTNGETGVVIDNSDPEGDLIVPFTWEPSTTGGAPSTYNFYIGITPAGNDIGNISVGNSLVNLIYTWQENTTYYWFVEAVNGTGTSAPSAIFSFTTASCTATSAPLAVSGPVPANGATIDLNADGNSTTFSWTPGSTDDFFTLYIGTANPPTQAISSFEIGETLNGLEQETTYYWSIESVNCFGRTTSPVWSFTTSDVLLSVDDNQFDVFSVYPNPTEGTLHIKALQDINTIEVFNLLGQNVMSFKNNDIINNTINLSQLSKGMYLVRISSGNKTETIKVTKD